MPLSNAIGLDPLSPYYMLMMRNIIPEGSRDSFQSYLQGEPDNVWGQSNVPRASYIPTSSSCLPRGYSSLTMPPKPYNSSLNMAPTWF